MKKINEHQKNLYASFASDDSEEHLKRYLRYLKEVEHRKNIKILDIGGATGHFAFLLKKHFEDNGVEVYVVDTTCYDTWDKEYFGNDVKFICDSIDNLKLIFEDNSFDLIFANRVFHHFIQPTWYKSLQDMDEYMHAIHHLLKEDGMFCVMDHFYNGALIDSLSSFLVYTCTSIQTPFISKIVKKLGAESAGVGTCFLSEKMWRNKLKLAEFEIMKIEKTKLDRMTMAKRILMFKSASRDNLIIALPQKAK